jgi:hypothetical protein
MQLLLAVWWLTTGSMQPAPFELLQANRWVLAAEVQVRWPLRMRGFAGNGARKLEQVPV